MTDVLLWLCPIYIKAIEFGKTMQHANKETCGSPNLTNIPTVYNICCGGEVSCCHDSFIWVAWKVGTDGNSFPIWRRTLFRLTLDAAMNNCRCSCVWLYPNHFIKPSAPLQGDIFPVVCYLGLPIKNTFFCLH